MIFVHPAVEVVVSPVRSKVDSNNGDSDVSTYFLPTIQAGDDNGGDGPNLIPIDSSSESDNSTDAGFANDDSEVISFHDECGEHSDINAETAPQNECIGPVDCLADNFASYFCPFATPEEPSSIKSSSSPTTIPTSSASMRSSNEAAAPTNHQFEMSNTCSEFQLDAFFNKSGLQYWLQPGIEAPDVIERPRNRITSRRSRNHHVRKVYNRWHGINDIPLQRARSEGYSLFSEYDDDDTGATDLCYDSDPEEEYKRVIKPAPRANNAASSSTTNSMEGGPLYKKHRPAPIVTTFIHDDYDDMSFDCPHPLTPRNSDGHGGFFNSPRSSTDKLTEMDLLRPSQDNTVKQIVQEVTSGRVHLTWHKPQSQTTATSNPGVTIQHQPQPCAVTAWFEIGAHLDYSIVQPKFVWNETHEPNLERKKVRLSCSGPNGIELLSIVRVLKPKSIDRKLYPYARLDRTCVVLANDERMHVFEAKTVQERDWFANVLKIMVARLASIVIVRDDNMLWEFFSPYAFLSELEGASLDATSTSIRSNSTATVTITEGEQVDKYAPGGLSEVDYRDDGYSQSFEDYGDFTSQDAGVYETTSSGCSAPFLYSVTDRERERLWGTRCG